MWSICIFIITCEDEGRNYEGDVSLDGIYEPYILDTWSGNVGKLPGM